MTPNYNMLFELMEILGKKWAVHLLVFLFIVKKTNFSIIKKRLHITSRALSIKLKALTKYGLVKKLNYVDTKIFYYCLTEKGNNLVHGLLLLSRYK